MDVYGLIGDPIAHSVSPAMFEAAFEAIDADAAYVPYRVESADLEAAVHGASALSIAGVNVTIPHKAAVLEWARPDATADAIGAANVLTFDRDGPAATNTDVVAMSRVLEGLDCAVDRAVVIGAGGAARAYIHALVAAGWQVDIANRTLGHAEDIAARYDRVRAHPLAAADDLAEAATLVLNATPVGLEGEAIPIAVEALTDEHAVVDAVYRPGDTPLITTARELGATVVSGDELLLEQAVATFERWRSASPPRAAMASALERSLAR